MATSNGNIEAETDGVTAESRDLANRVYVPVGIDGLEIDAPLI